MLDLIKLLFDICLLKKTPQDLPYSSGLLKILATANLGINFLLMNLSTDWFNAVLKAAVGVLLIGSFSWIHQFFIDESQYRLVQRGLESRSGSLAYR